MKDEGGGMKKERGFRFAFHPSALIPSREPVAQRKGERDCAKVEGAGSNPAGFTKFIRSNEILLRSRQLAGNSALNRAMQVRLLPPQPKFLQADVAQLARGACFRHKRLRVQISPRAPIRSSFMGMWANWIKPLEFQSRECEFKSRHPYQKICGRMLCVTTFFQNVSVTRLFFVARYLSCWL